MRQAEKAKCKNPKNTRYECIVNGNHAGFGDYGKQFRDTVTDLSPNIQQEEACGWLLPTCLIQ